MRWRAGAAPGYEEERLWDVGNEYGDSFTSEACRSCPVVCSDCSQPRLLRAAEPAALAFLWCRSQWQYAPSGLPTGLRYADCMVLLRARVSELGLARADLPQLLAQLQVAEQAYVQANVERWQKEHDRHGGR